ncbi:MAG: helix-turn-helix transcriptional regulator [Planctomycetota bacterium]|jgi:transcriptional regulator with XRE-family HTH domain
MFPIVNKGFSGWLQGELDKREWSQADLARKAGFSRAAISLVISQDRKPGPDFCRAIAKALELPEEHVFRKASLLSPKPDGDKDPPSFLDWIRC